MLSLLNQYWLTVLCETKWNKTKTILCEMKICTLTSTLYLNSLKLPAIKRLAIFLVQDIQKIRMARGSRVSRNFRPRKHRPQTPRKCRPRKHRPLENLHGVLWSRSHRRTIYKFQHNPLSVLLVVLMSTLSLKLSRPRYVGAQVSLFTNMSFIIESKGQMNLFKNFTPICSPS